MATDNHFKIDKDHPCLEGHFPGNPIVPGVVILDEIIDCVLKQNNGYKVCSLNNVKFLQPLKAEQSVEINAPTTDNTTDNEVKIKFSASCQGNLIVQGLLKLCKQ